MDPRDRKICGLTIEWKRDVMHHRAVAENSRSCWSLETGRSAIHMHRSLEMSWRLSSCEAFRQTVFTFVDVNGLLCCLTLEAVV